MLEPEPILQEDMDKLTNQIKEIELENTQLRLQLNCVKERNHVLEDKGKQVCEKFEESKKRLWIADGQRVWVGGTLQGVNSELDFPQRQVESSVPNYQGPWENHWKV